VGIIPHPLPFQIPPFPCLTEIFSLPKNENIHVDSKKGSDIKCQKKTGLGLHVKAEGHVMVEVAGKAVHRERAQALKPVAKS